VKRTLMNIAKRAIVVAAALALLQPVAVSADSTSPVRIDSCDVKKLNSQTGIGNLFVNGKAYNFFNVTFTNTAAVAAKRIVFQIDFDKSRYVVGDDGTYAPGDQVTHHLRDHGSDVQASARPGGGGPTQCSVVMVTFVDGTSWNSPAAQAPSPSPSPMAP
jgi:hypothetical protein